MNYKMDQKKNNEKKKQHNFYSQRIGNQSYYGL